MLPFISPTMTTEWSCVIAVVFCLGVAIAAVVEPDAFLAETSCVPSEGSGFGTTSLNFCFVLVSTGWLVALCSVLSTTTFLTAGWGVATGLKTCIIFSLLLVDIVLALLLTLKGRPAPTKAADTMLANSNMLTRTFNIRFISMTPPNCKVVVTFELRHI